MGRPARAVGIPGEFRMEFEPIPTVYEAAEVVACGELGENATRATAYAVGCSMLELVPNHSLT